MSANAEKTPSKIASKLSLLTLSNLKIGVLTALLAQPFEVVRTSSIVHRNKINSLNFKGMLSVIKLIQDSEGLKGFFRGGGLSIFKTTFGYFFFFSGLESMNYLSDKSRENMAIFKWVPFQVSNFINAMCSKMVTTVIVSPINVLKTRFEVVGNDEYSSVRHAVKKIFEKEGVYGFYRGTFATVLRDGPYSGIQYSLYKSLLDLKSWHQGNSDHGKGYIALSAGISGAIAILLTYPFDNIRVRYQYSQAERKSLWVFCEEIYRNEGMEGFYKGYLPRVLKKICSAAVTWSVYEHIKKGSGIEKM